METEKKQSKFVWFYEKVINFEGLILSGKNLMNLILLALAINFSLDWVINGAGKILLSNHIFVLFFMLGVIIMPMYVCYKSIEELEAFPTWIIIIGAIGGLVLNYFNIF